MVNAFEALRGFDPSELRDPHSGKWSGGAVSGAARKVAKSLADAFHDDGLSGETHSAEGSYGDVAFAAHGTGDVRMAFHDSETGEARKLDLSDDDVVGLADAVDELSQARRDLHDDSSAEAYRVDRVDFGADSEHSASLYSNGLIEIKFYELDDESPFVLDLDPGDGDGEGDDVPQFVKAVNGAAAEAAAKTAGASRSNAFEALRNFSPGELRDPDGKWTKSPKTELKDTLKLADRIQLGQGEEFAGSGKVRDKNGDVSAVMASIDTPEGRKVRFGLVNPEDERKWRASDKGATVELDKHSASQLRETLQGSAEAGRDSVKKYYADVRKAHSAGVPLDEYPPAEEDIASGVIRASWGDVHWKLTREADTGPEISGIDAPGSGWSLGFQVKPKGGSGNASEDYYVETPAQAKALDKLLAELAGAAPTAARSGAAGGAPLGGQFALGGGHVAGQGQKQVAKQRHAAVKPVVKPKAPAGPQRFSYDPKTNRGAGYGIKGGDPNVRILQADMNRLGLGDEHGKALSVDGRYGPHTTASVKKLQKSLGLAQTGQVDANLIKQVSALKALPAHPMAHPPARTAPRKAVAHRSAATHGGIMQSGTLTRRSPQVFDRSYPLDDIQISRSGDGRTVEAYAAIFGQPYEVHDGYGHYMEVIDRAAFNRTLTGGAGKQAMCLYNHGMTVHGTADALSSVPLGTPLEIKADTRGLLTVTRYNRSQLADSVLESIRNGDIRAQSFRGRIVRSSPDNVPRVSRGAALPTITRHELGLTDYGPTPVPVNAGAEIMAVRSLTELIEDFQHLDDAERFEVLRALDLAPSTLDGDSEDDEGIERSDDTSTTSSHDELGAEDSPTGHSGRLLIARAALTAQLRLRGVIRG